MKLLLDTHALLWADSASAKVSPTAQSLLADPANERLLSVASVWEMQIKSQLGKLRLRLPLRDLIAEQVSKNGLRLVDITASHVLEISALPPLHNDPFDRLIIAAARIEGATILTHDSLVRQYPVATIW
ncbi:MAG: type II toxin-antitoxin system VapC family toxin [Verrucomicrobia bacterium]|nr:type II toxin-antitoxin system VapC family toxin [Verrucomicrobiota bacterium]